MSNPQIRVTDIRDRYKFLWVKEISDVDLTQHCARSFVGRWRAEMSHAHDRWRDSGARTPFDYLMTLGRARAYYACGVTDPYVWRKNAHLAFVPDPAAEEWETHSNQGLTVQVRGLSRVSFSAEDVPDTDPRRVRKDFYTCRNWQFAQWLHSRTPQTAMLFDEPAPPVVPPAVWPGFFDDDLEA